MRLSRRQKVHRNCSEIYLLENIILTLQVYNHLIDVPLMLTHICNIQPEVNKEGGRKSRSCMTLPTSSSQEDQLEEFLRSKSNQC
jgi:hypothetical protein